MTIQVEKEPAGKKNPILITLLTAAVVVPAFLWVVAGWASCFFPLLVFLGIQKYGWRYFSSQLIIAMLVAIVLGYALQSLELTLFTLALAPTGYVIAHAVQQENPPWQAGLKGWITLCVSFLIFFGALLSDSNLNFFEAITASMNAGIDEALRQYNENSTISADSYIALESTLTQIKMTAPLILPGIFGGMLLVLSWFTLVVGSALHPRLGLNHPWPKYGYWKLPEKLVWVAIVAGIFTIVGGEQLQRTAVNALLILSIIYCFQGLAIFTFMLNKWKAPPFVRSILYIIMVLQTFGTILLLLAGIADVWCDFRKISSTTIDDKPD